MLFEKTNIEKKLAGVKKRQKIEASLLREVYSLLEKSTAKENQIKQNNYGMWTSMYVFNLSEIHRLLPCFVYN